MPPPAAWRLWHSNMHEAASTSQPHARKHRTDALAQAGRALQVVTKAVGLVAEEPLAAVEGAAPLKSRSLSVIGAAPPAEHST